MGWIYISPDEALRMRRGQDSPLLWKIFIEKVQALNPRIVDHIKAEEIGRRIAMVPPSIEGNLQAWEFLKGLKTVFVESEKRERNVRLVDFENIERNAFYVTDEFRFSNGVYSIRPDIVFLLNGIPIILIETKAATKLEGIEEGLSQVRRYHLEGPELLSIVQIFGITHIARFYYGATWNILAKNLFNWKQESAARDFETLVKTFVIPSQILRLIRDYILFVRKEDELQKVILRPHQIRAVERALVRCKDPQKHRGLIWHTQGSGKTYTMITIAKRLIEDPIFENPTVLMLVDRNELETQLFGNLASTLGIGHVEVASSKQHLRQLLAQDTRGLIVSMIHKFDDIPANINTRDNIFVLVDEAHRTTGGDLGNYLMGALPNATYLGFTGTPIDKTSYGKGTFKVFGIYDPKGYLDKYSIAESIEDGTTVPLYYSLAPNELRVDRETLEKEFLDLAGAEGVSDIEDLNNILDRAVHLKNMLKNYERVDKVAQYVAKHYTEAIEPMGYKAFLVGVDREACCLLKKALDRYLPPEYSRVLISPSHNDPPEIAKFYLPEREEESIRKAFTKPDQLPKILIITEKLLTGYDAPILYCMYLDKPMRDHVLLQAIARVNRPYEDENGKHKPGGFILDFVGIFENLTKALAFDSQDVSGIIEGVENLKTRFTEMMKQGCIEYLKPLEGKEKDKAADLALNIFMDDEKRKEFYDFFEELEDIYEILSPDPFLREYLEDYQQLADLYALLRAAYEAGKPTNRDLAKKTARLVQELTKSGAFHEAIEIFEITPKTLEEISQTQKPDTVKVFNLIKSIVNEVQKKGSSEPYLIPIGEKAERIAQDFKERQLTTQQALQELRELIRQRNEAQKQHIESGLSTEAFTLNWLLIHQFNVPKDVSDMVVKVMEDTLQTYPYWRTHEAQKREVKKIFLKQLNSLKMDAKRKIDMVNKILEILERYQQ
jgi:type I restriction enzyme R subunit